MRKISPMLLCLVSLTSCGISVHSDGAVLESIHEIGPLEGESRLQAEVHLDVGHLAIDQGDASDLYEVELSFKGRLLEPHLVVKREGDLARLKYEVRQGWMDGSPNTRLYLRLNPLVELDLLAQAGVGDSKIDLTGLSTRSFSLNSGVGETTLSMLEPNRISCDRVTINSGVGSLNVTGLGNFGFKEFVFNGGVGTAKLDFSGEWSQDGDVDIDVGVGSLELRIPRDVGAEIRTGGGFLSKCCMSGFKKEGNTYFSENLDRAEKVIRFDIQKGVGSINIKWL